MASLTDLIIELNNRLKQNRVKEKDSSEFIAWVFFITSLHQQDLTKRYNKKIQMI